MRNIIGATYTDRFDLKRYRAVGNAEREELIYENEPCDLSRSAYAHSPTPVGYNSPFAKTEYNLRLYAAPEIDFRLGDRVEIKRGEQIFFGVSSDGFRYDSHAVCIVKIERIEHD